MRTRYIPLVVTVALLSLPITADADRKSPKANGNSNSVNGCPVVGIKSTGVFYRSNQRACFANVSKAARKGYEAASNDSALRGFSFDLTGAEEVPAVTTSATGNCLAAFLPDQATLEVMCTHTLGTTSAAHVHSGAIGVDGSVICNLGTGTSPISATCTLTTDQRTALLNGDLYVNIHTAANPDGELRGQID